MYSKNFRSRQNYSFISKPIRKFFLWTHVMLNWIPSDFNISFFLMKGWWLWSFWARRVLKWKAENLKPRGRTMKIQMGWVKPEPQLDDKIVKSEEKARREALKQSPTVWYSRLQIIRKDCSTVVLKTHTQVSFETNQFTNSLNNTVQSYTTANPGRRGMFRFPQQQSKHC